MNSTPYRGFRFPKAIIQHAIWLYLRFTLSLRDVEELLAERGIVVTYETVRVWVGRFGPLIARRLSRRRGPPSNHWHLDEMLIPSAKSGGLGKSGEGIYPCLGARESYPQDHLRR